MGYPRITYTDDSGAAQTVTFQLPPTKKPYAWKSAVRTDNISTCGVRQTIVQRIERFLEINLDCVDQGDDIAQWDAFTDYALEGGEFAYFADGDIDVSKTYTLEDTDWKAQRAQVKQSYTFTLKFREAVAG